METKERILIIEDSEEITNFLTDSILNPSGYETLTARDGQEGLRRALEELPDLILLDLRMPRMTGMEVLQALQARGSTIPVILMTFYGSEEVAVEAFRLGVRNYIVKPFKPQQVVEAIESALGESRLRREKALLTEELMRTNKQLEQRVRELTTLYEITQAMTGLLNLETLLSRVVEASVFLSKADEGMLFLLDEETDELYLRAAKGVGDKYAHELRLRADDSLIGQVATTGEPLRIASPEARLDLKVNTGYMVNSLLYVPLKLRGEVKGVLGVSNRVSDRAFTQADQHRLNLLADQAVIAVENTRLYENEQSRSMHLAMTSHLSQRISSILDVDALLSQVVELLKQNFGYYYAQVFLQEQPGYLIMRDGTGEAGQSIRRTSSRVKIDDQTVVGWAATNAEALCTNDVAQDDRFSPHELLPHTEAELALPLRAGGEVIGVLDIHSDQKNAFKNDDPVIFQVLSDQIAVAIQNARSYERTKGQMPDTFRETLASVSQYAHEPLKALATSTYALKAGVEKGSIACADSSLNRRLTSMERRIEQMAALTEILNKLASPETTAENGRKLQQKFERLKARNAS